MKQKHPREPVTYPNEQVYRWNKRNPWNAHLRNARSRCNNPKTNGYRGIGGRGIKCRLDNAEIRALWIAYKADLMVRPALRRRDLDKDYDLENAYFKESRPRKSK